MIKTIVRQYGAPDHAGYSKLHSQKSRSTAALRQCLGYSG